MRAAPSCVVNHSTLDLILRRSAPHAWNKDDDDDDDDDAILPLAAGRPSSAERLVLLLLLLIIIYRSRRLSRLALVHRKKKTMVDDERPKRATCQHAWTSRGESPPKRHAARRCLLACAWAAAVAAPRPATAAARCMSRDHIRRREGKQARYSAGESARAAATATTYVRGGWLTRP